MQSQLVYANYATRRPSGSVTGDTYTFPAYFVGQQVKLSFRFLDRVNDAIAEIFPKIRAMRGSVGRIDARPDSGTVRFQIGPGVSEIGNTTDTINWADPSNEIKAKLNALTAITPKDFDVTEDNGSYFVRRSSGDEFELTVRENTLRPVSFVRKREWSDERGFVCELRFIQSPVAFTSAALQVLPPKPSIVTLEDGFTDDSNTFRRNEKQRLTIPRTFRGQFYIEKTPLKSALLAPASGLAQIKAAAESLFAATEGAVITVSNPDVRIADLVFGGSLAGLDVPELKIGVPLEGTPPGDWTIILDFNTIEAWAAVRKSDEVSIPFELEIEVPEDEEDDNSASKVVKLWVENITLRRPVNWEGLETAQPLNWLLKPNPKTYLPYNETQYALGELAYQSPAFGDGVTKHFAFNHNLGSLALTGLRGVNLVDGRVLRDSEYDAHATNSGNTLELDFSVAPAANSLRFFLAVPQTIEMFLADLRVDIANVDGLQDILNDYGTRIAAIEAILPSTGAPATPASGVGYEIEIPMLSEVLFYKGDSPWTEKGFDLSKFPAKKRPRPLFRAIHDATASNNDLSTLPEPGDIRNNVITYTGALDKLISPGEGLPSAYVKTGQYVGSDGSRLYKVQRSGVSSSYYPDAFIRTPIKFAVNPQQLAVNRTLDFQFGAQCLIAKGNCVAQWMLNLYFGVVEKETSPGTPAENVVNIATGAPFLSQRIILTENLESHFFGFRLKRLASSFALDIQRYGVWSGYNAGVPPNADFVVLGKFEYFDVEDASYEDGANGYAAYRLIGSMTTDEKGNQIIKPPKAIIS